MIRLYTKIFASAVSAFRIQQQVAFLLLVLFPCIAVAFSTATFPAVNELRDIASASTLKVPGSLSYLRTWHHWSELSIQLIRSEFIANLPTPVDREALTKLSFQLGVAADTGSMPSFEHDGARAGYAADYFCRAQLMADILFSSECAFWKEDADRLWSSGTQCNIGSLGGGPGYDFVAAALIATYKSQQQRPTTTLPPPVSLRATIYDYQHGWAPLVEKMASAVEHTLGGAHSCRFGGCDITLPLSDPTNAACLGAAFDTHVWFCSYCVAENARKLRDGNFIFFRDLFHAAKPGALFVFTETTHRLWPDFAAIIIANTAGFDVAFPKSRGNRQNHQMVLRKRVGATLGKKEMEWCKVFERHNEMHERKIRNGRERQLKKIRGAK
jgi:hypothetical protein